MALGDSVSLLFHKLDASIVNLLLRLTAVPCVSAVSLSVYHWRVFPADGTKSQSSLVALASKTAFISKNIRITYLPCAEALTEYFQESVAWCSPFWKEENCWRAVGADVKLRKPEALYRNTRNRNTLRTKRVETVFFSSKTRLKSQDNLFLLPICSNWLQQHWLISSESRSKE